MPIASSLRAALARDVGATQEDPTTFVVGLEGGQLFKGSLLANELRSINMVQREMVAVGEVKEWGRDAAQLMTRVPQASYPRIRQRAEKEAAISRESTVTPSHVYRTNPEPRELFASPLSFRYRAHSGPVYAACYSPFHRNVFLTASTDGSIRFYNQLAPQPFHIIEPAAGAPLLATAWSPSRPLVFAAAAGDGQLYIFDLKKSKGRPEVTLKVTTDKSAVTSVSFNPMSPELLATADSQGAIKIWRLSTVRRAHNESPTISSNHS